MNELVISLLQCPSCKGDVKKNETSFVCLICGRLYIIENKKSFFVVSQKLTEHNIGKNDNIIHKLKVFFKKYPFIFSFLYYTFGVLAVGKQSKNILPKQNENKIILNIGSGIKRIRDDVINIDAHPFPNVDVVCDVYALPFKNDSIDIIVSECLLEHLANPSKAVSEMSRALKNGGTIYASVPFIAQYHSSPGDYYRWTLEGIKEIMKQNQIYEIESGIMFGPTSAFSIIFVEWLSTLLSFGSGTFYQCLVMLFTVITAPIKLLDYALVHIPSAENSSYGFYFIGRKNRIRIC